MKLTTLNLVLLVIVALLGTAVGLTRPSSPQAPPNERAFVAFDPATLLEIQIHSRVTQAPAVILQRESAEAPWTVQNRAGFWAEAYPIEQLLGQITNLQARDLVTESADGLTLFRLGPDAGIEVVVRQDVKAIQRLHASFHARVSTGLPWVVTKWAETSGGELSTPPDVSPWISGPRSLRMVHRERGRIDAILTGIGTILADDPRLDAREVRRRRTPIRVIVDPDVETPPTASILKTAGGQVIIACRDDGRSEFHARSARLTAAGATILPIQEAAGKEASDGVRGTLRGRFSAGRMRSLLRRLVEDYEVATLLTECGPGLLRSLFEADLVDAALVFTAMATTDVAHSPATPLPRDLLQKASFETIWSGRRGEDRVVWSQRSA